MKKELDLGYRSLKNLVYDYVRDQMQKGELRQGETINMEQTAKKLGVSKTPLREALIKLEAEGFVKIQPWRGVLVSVLTLQEFKDSYQIIGALECSALMAAAPRMKKHDIARMEILNEEMQEAIEAGNFDAYYDRNIEFHRTYLRLAENQALFDTVDILKKKLYEFSRPKEFIKEWEDVSMGEHRQLVAMLKQGDFAKAADFLRSIIWSFEAQKKYIIKYYKFENKET
jgi:DNA-binding GntR family transcriptional regulator